MKKILLALSMLMMMLFVGCSSAAPLEYDKNIYDVFSYSYRKGEFSNVENSDIFKYFIDYTSDRELMMEFALDEDLISEYTANESILLGKVALIIEETSRSYEDLFDSTSQEFNAYAVEAGVELSIDDIVSFNDLKIKLSEAGVVFINKLTFIEFKFDRSLTTDEISGYNLLQEVYLDLLEHYGTYDLTNKTYDDLVADTEEIRTVISEEDREILEIGYDLIKK